MELFHEYKNKYFNLVLKIINLSQNGLSKEEIIKIVSDEEYDEKIIGKCYETFEGIVLNQYDEENNLNLLKEENNTYYSTLSKRNQLPIKIRFSKIEKTWINALIEREDVQAILGKDIVNKLEKSLEDIHEGSNKVIDFTNKNKLDKNYKLDEVSEKFYCIVEAIKEGKDIIYTNVDRRGNKYTNKRAVPLRIEYSLKDDRFRVSLYSIDGERVIMVNLHTLSDVSVSTEKSAFNRKELLESMKINKYCDTPVTIVLRDIRGAMERCFMSFSSFQRSSRKIGINTYEIDINYYKFQEQEVIAKIMALGPYVMVKGPENIRKRIIEKIKEASSYQKS